MRAAGVSIALSCILLWGCSVSPDEHAQACGGDADCAPGFHCYARFCLQDDVGADAGGCTNAGAIESCYDGPAETRDVGICHGGQRVCVNAAYTECLGQVLPQTDVCNDKDDDCNGAVDDADLVTSCDTRLKGACAEGTLVCRAGTAFCQPLRESQAESCNAVDDDCDGSVDEVVASSCYPDGVPGCAFDPRAGWQCQGSCTTGAVGCDGEQTCNGAATPGEEVCTTDEEFAQDENCDGEVDENCACTDGDSRACYGGPANTNGHGICRAGKQTCVGSEWAPCVDQVVPRAETCGNRATDDDCNDVVDDIPGLGAACVMSEQRGLCREGTLRCVGDEIELQCVGPGPAPEVCDEIDQDCDGDPTNGFDLGSDDTCGACDVQCSSGSELCCGGACIARSSLDEDAQNCGACGNACGAGQYCCQGTCLSKATMMTPPCDCPSSCGSLSCCGMTCRDLQADKDNCGACGVKCGRGKTCVAGVCKSET